MGSHYVLANRIRLKAFDGDCWYKIDLHAKTCDCTSFRITERCEHLDVLGIHRTKPFTPSTRPTFSQALSALVKSIRLRRVGDAVYWLVYLDSRFRDRQYRFPYKDASADREYRWRTARRLLIASAEDGHSISVMEEVAQRFRVACRPETELLHLIADAVRICKQPNWWHPDSGGPAYIYQSLIGQRTFLYQRRNHTVSMLLDEIRTAIRTHDPAGAVGGILAFEHLPEQYGASKQAEFLLAAAEEMGHEHAARLCRVHLSARTALSSDNNFLCQAAWLMAGGQTPIANENAPVTMEECQELLQQANERWRSPQPIPRWCLDGVHSAGDDPRFMGTYPAMWAVCKAYQHYLHVDPDDVWLPEFQCFHGLVIEEGW
jgi:hypothetical protein